MRRTGQRVDLSLRDKAYFHFALLKAVKLKGEYEEAFFHLEKGNKLRMIKVNILLKEWIESFRLK